MAEIINMPKMSDTMSVGTLVTWLKKEGDKVASTEPIAEVETDKATMELENFVDGVILKHYVSEGDQIPVGDPICAIGEEGEEAPEAPGGAKKEAPKKEAKKESPEPKEDPAKEEKSEPAPKKEEAPAPKQPAVAASANGSNGSTTETGRVKASPLARRIAQEKGVDLQSLSGTGPGGRIIRADVETAAKEGPKKSTAPSAQPAVAAVPFTEEKDLPVSNMRATIARRLVESKTQIPHFYLETEIVADPLTELRKELNAKLGELSPEQGGIKFTINDFILKASAEALRRVPEVNASWQEKSIRQHGGVHMAFGVAVPEGLLTPVIRDAHAKTLRQISVEAKELIEKARNKKLKPEEMTGSTFTVTNLGMFGITSFYGIINPPNAGILSIGTTVQQPLVNEKGELTMEGRMKVGFSGDHRVVDGATGARFLQALKEILETPALMLV